MVEFGQDRYTIEVITGANPVEDWQELHRELSYIFTLLTPDNMPRTGLYHLANLIKELQPDWSIAKKMNE